MASGVWCPESPAKVAGPWASGVGAVATPCGAAPRVLGMLPLQPLPPTCRALPFQVEGRLTWKPMSSAAWSTGLMRPGTLQYSPLRLPASCARTRTAERTTAPPVGSENCEAGQAKPASVWPAADGSRLEAGCAATGATGAAWQAKAKVAPCRGRIFKRVFAGVLGGQGHPERGSRHRQWGQTALSAGPSTAVP